MKQLFLFLVAAFLSMGAFAQQQQEVDNDVPVYKRFPTIPLFEVFTAADSSSFTRDNLVKNKPTLFFIFSPDCEHCQHETEMLKQNIDKFKNVQILMITYLPYADMIKFYKDYNIADYPQIVMARDTKFFFPQFFKVRNMPSLFVYDKKGNLKKSFEGSVKMDDILKAINN